MRPRRFMSDEQLLAALRDEAKRLGRTPGTRDVGRGDSLCPVERVYCKRFGSFGNACRMAGLPARKRGELANPDRRPHPISRIERFARSDLARRITEDKKRAWGMAS